VKYLLDDFIQYAADTKNGSSGSPVFNDQWAVVAVHHASVRDPNRKTVWIANEGVRISSIANFVKKEYEKADAKTQTVMEGIFMELKESDKKKKYQLKADQYRDGYDPLFLGEDYRIDLPGLSAKMEEDSTRTKDGGNVLDYVHFSIIMRRSRGLAYFTAVNIDGKSAKDIKRKNDKWSFDSRIPRIHQYGEEVYAKNDLDRGHLVRRLDPVWGEYKTASQANNDTFYFTNSAPQHKNLNQKTWLGLENYLLNNAQNHGLRISVFTGPVFKDEDMKYREKYLIPDEFWKIVAMVKKDGALSVTAYIQSQQDYLSELEEFVYGPYQTYQVPVALIEELTGLDFGELYKSDPMEAYESTGLLISELTNIIL
jgi:endonuclease G